MLLSNIFEVRTFAIDFIKVKIKIYKILQSVDKIKD